MAELKKGHWATTESGVRIFIESDETFEDAVEKAFGEEYKDKLKLEETVEEKDEKSADETDKTKEEEIEEIAEELEEEDWNYLDSETMAKLKATEKGKDLILNAPTMAKEELKKAIQEYLKEN